MSIPELRTRRLLLRGWGEADLVNFSTLNADAKVMELLLRPWSRGELRAGVGARFGFEDAGLQEIVAFTVPHNRRSRAVMERLGMTRREEDDFDHPRIEPGNPLLQHVLYRLGRDAWQRGPRARLSRSR